MRRTVSVVVRFRLCVVSGCPKCRRSLTQFFTLAEGCLAPSSRSQTQKCTSMSCGAQNLPTSIPSAHASVSPQTMALGDPVTPSGVISGTKEPQIAEAMETTYVSRTLRSSMKRAHLSTNRTVTPMLPACLTPNPCRMRLQSVGAHTYVFLRSHIRASHRVATRAARVLLAGGEPSTALVPTATAVQAPETSPAIVPTDPPPKVMVREPTEAEFAALALERGLTVVRIGMMNSRDVDWPACSRSAFQREHRVRSPRQGRRWSTTPPKHETPSAGSGWAPSTHIILTQGQCPSLASARAVGGSTPLGPESRVAGARTSTVRLRSQGGQTRSKVPASPPLARPSHPALAC